MSINSMANAAAARRVDIGVANETPRKLDDIAKAASTTPKAAGAAPQADGADSLTTAQNVLFGYIPTEVITVYVGVFAALSRQSGAASTPDDTVQFEVTQGMQSAFWFFLAVTPIVVWLVYGAKVMAAGKPIPLRHATWPIWEMCAATIAFFAWAFALPGNPFSTEHWYSSALAGVVVLVVSTALGLIAPFFQRKLAVEKPATEPDGVSSDAGSRVTIPNPATTVSLADTRQK